MNRIPLQSQEILTLDRPYQIQQCIGKGQTCLVYMASAPGPGNSRQKVLIRELYPASSGWVRKGQTLSGAKPAADEKPAASCDFSELAESVRPVESADSRQPVDPASRWKEPFVKTCSMMIEISQDILGAQGVYPMGMHEANGTLYLVQNWQGTALLETYRPQNVREVFRLCLSACQIAEKLHEQSYVLLDLKPDNLLVLPEFQALCLIDFDSIVCADGRQPIRSTPGFSAPELAKNTYSFASDIYSMGALLFWMLFGKSAKAKDGEHRAEYPFEESPYASQLNAPYVQRQLTDFFHQTLCAWPKGRLESMKEVKERLQQLIGLSSPDRSRVCFWKANVAARAPGRDREISQLQKHLEEASLFQLYGLAGIGKSSLAAQALRDREEVIWLYPRGSLRQMLADDLMFSIEGMRPEMQERQDEYVLRKLSLLKAHHPDTLFVIDQLEDQNLDLSLLTENGFSVLLVSRTKTAGIEGMEVQAIDSLTFWMEQFHYHTGRKMTEKQQEALECVARATGYHTLLLSLLCSMSAMHPKLLEQAQKRMEEGTLGFLQSGSSVCHNGKLTSGQLSALAKTLLLDKLSAQALQLLELLSLFSRPVDSDHLRHLCSMDEHELAQLEKLGWYSKLVHPLVAALFGAQTDSVLSKELEQSLCQGLQPDFLPYQTSIYDRAFQTVPLEAAVDIALQMLPSIHDKRRQDRLLCHLFVMMPFSQEDFFHTWQSRLDEARVDDLLWYRALDKSIHFNVQNKELQQAQNRLQVLAGSLDEAYLLLLEMDVLDAQMDEMAMRHLPHENLQKAMIKKMKKALRRLPEQSVEYQALALGYVNVLLNGGFRKKAAKWLKPPQAQSMVPAWILTAARLDPSLSAQAEEMCLEAAPSFLPMDRIDAIYLPLSSMYLDLEDPAKGMEYLQRAWQEALMHTGTIWQKKAQQVEEYIQELCDEFPGLTRSLDTSK